MVGILEMISFLSYTHDFIHTHKSKLNQGYKQNKQDGIYVHLKHTMRNFF